MKKSISILSLITALVMQSCERSDADFTTESIQENVIPVSIKKNNQSYKTDENKSTAKGSDTEEPDTGDDDEPRRDKQHWRINKDSVRYH